jgi:hypothetical protein
LRCMGVQGLRRNCRGSIAGFSVGALEDRKTPRKFSGGAPLVHNDAAHA